MRNRYSKEEFVGGSLHYTAIFAPATLIIYSAYMLITNGLYSYIYPHGWNRALIHSISLLALSSSFLVIYHFLKYLYPLARLIITLVFTVFSIHFYDFMWSLTSQVQRGHGFSGIALIGIVVTLILLERLDNKHGFIRATEIGFLLAGTIAFSWYFSFGMMGFYGFWEKMSLYDLGLGSDPNIGNIYWLLTKVIVFLFPLPFIRRRNYSVPLKLDPRVLIW